MSKCHICGADQKKSTPENCTRCGANLENSGEETVKKQSGRSKFKNNGAFAFWYGTVIVTNKRFICLDVSDMSSLGPAGGGVANALAGSIFKVGKHGFSFPIEQLKSVGYGRHGIRKTLAIQTSTGEGYHFLISKRDEWKEFLEKCVK